MEIGSFYKWETLGNKKHEGIVIEVDSNVAYIMCADGVTRAVEI